MDYNFHGPFALLVIGGHEGSAIEFYITFHRRRGGGNIIPPIKGSFKWSG